MILKGGSVITKKDTIVIYPGRFQPFHKGHHDVYRFLKERYEHVFIVTTDTKSKDKKRYPFNFKEKINIMKNLGRVEENDIFPEPVSNPYSDFYIKKYIRELKTKVDSLPEPLQSKIKSINLNNLLVLFAISDKDMNPTDGTKPRFIFPEDDLVYTKKTNNKGKPIPAKIQKVKSKKRFQNTVFNNISLNTNINYNFVLTVPTNIFSVLGENINSATQLRNMIISPPNNFTSMNVLEALYDMKVNKENIHIFKLIIKKIKEAYGISHRNSNSNSHRNSNNNNTITSIQSSRNTTPKTKKLGIRTKTNKTINSLSINTHKTTLRRSSRLRKNK